MELIRPEMTPLERARAYARGEEVDRIPTTLSAGETAPPLYGYSISEYYFSADAMVAVESGIAEDFQADNMGIGLGLRTLVEAMGIEMKYPEYSVSVVTSPLITDIQDIGMIEPVNVRTDGRFPIIIEAFERLMDKYGNVRSFGSGLAGPFTTAATLLGTEAFLKATIRDPEHVHELMQRSTDCVVECCRDLNQILGIKFMLSEPMGTKDLISKRQFDRFFKPYLDQAVTRMNEFQGNTSIHICGRTSDRWDDIVSSGISNFWVDNCEDLEELKLQHGSRIGITGNLAPVDVLKNGTPESIEDAVRTCINKAGDNPCGYTLSPGCTTPVGTCKGNMIAYMNAAYKYGRGARRGELPEGIRSTL